MISNLIDMNWVLFAASSQPASPSQAKHKNGKSQRQIKSDAGTLVLITRCSTARKHGGNRTERAENEEQSPVLKFLLDSEDMTKPVSKWTVIWNSETVKVWSGCFDVWVISSLEVLPFLCHRS